MVKKVLFVFMFQIACILIQTIIDSFLQWSLKYILKIYTYYYLTPITAWIRAARCLSEHKCLRYRTPRLGLFTTGTTHTSYEWNARTVQTIAGQCSICRIYVTASNTANAYTRRGLQDMTTPHSCRRYHRILTL